MAKWISCGNSFIPADVVRWTESVWEKRLRGRATRVGERAVTGQIVEEDAEGWLRVLVSKCVVVSEKTGCSVAMVLKGETIRRKRSTLVRGTPERLPWSDESARAVIASKFLGNR